jgi:hypothetical protein
MFGANGLTSFLERGFSFAYLIGLHKKLEAELVLRKVNFGLRRFDLTADY